MMPPGEGITKALVRGTHLAKPGEDDEAIQYFDLVLPRVKEQEGPKGSGRIPEIIEGVQYPGERRTQQELVCENVSSRVSLPMSIS